ncbi:MAG: type II toxin-antitoxin system VapC family toxin [Caldimonas sp.]|nr:type II toxin-antitoxin system VapC family toxin [Pseudomonadota bacterium]
MIAVDSSVLVDVLVEDPQFADAAEASLRHALAAGEVVVCDAVVAEIHTMLAASEATMESLLSLGIRYLPTTEQAAVRAGHMQRRFRDRGGRRERVVADFLIGAHALLQCDALVTRDAVFFRDYFKGLKVIEPRVR